MNITKLFIPIAHAHSEIDSFGHHMFSQNGWGMGGGVVMILFWILVIIGIVFLLKYLLEISKGGRQDKTPLDILKGRYAKGEIDKKEFEEKKKELS